MLTALTVEPKSTLVLKLFQYYSIRTLMFLCTQNSSFLGQNRSAKLEVDTVDLHVRDKVRGMLNPLQCGGGSKHSESMAMKTLILQESVVSFYIWENFSKHIKLKYSREECSFHCEV